MLGVIEAAVLAAVLVGGPLVLTWSLCVTAARADRLAARQFRAAAAAGRHSVSYASRLNPEHAGQRRVIREWDRRRQ